MCCQVRAISEVIMEALMRLNATRAGHDKLIRSAQYACRFTYAKNCYNLIQIIHRLVATSKPSSAAQARQLETTLSSARKLLRLGTCIDALHSSVASVGHPDIVLRVTITLSRISNAMFLLCDHFIWLHRAKVINVDVDGWNELSNRWWLYGDIMNLARDIYEVRKEGSFLLENKPLLVDLVKNLADIVLPLAALGERSHSLPSPSFLLQVT